MLESEEKDFAQKINPLHSVEISENQVFYVFEGEINNHKEWFVANIEQENESDWVVIEAVNIGLPNSQQVIARSGGTTSNAGIKSNSEEIKDDWKIVNIPNSDYYVWIELRN